MFKGRGRKCGGGGGVKGLLKLGEFRLEALSVALHVLHVTGQALIFTVELIVPLKLPNLQYAIACHNFIVQERAWSRGAQALAARMPAGARGAGGVGLEVEPGGRRWD